MGMNYLLHPRQNGKPSMQLSEEKWIDEIEKTLDHPLFPYQKVILRALLHRKLRLD